MKTSEKHQCFIDDVFIAVSMVITYSNHVTYRVSFISFCYQQNISFGMLLRQNQNDSNFCLGISPPSYFSMAEEQIIRRILEDTESTEEVTIPKVIDDVFLLLIGIAWIVICFFLFILGKKCIERSVRVKEEQRLQY